MKYLFKTSILLLFITFSCKEPFSPEVDANFKNALVVEGYLHVGGSTSFTLSRSGDLKDIQARIPEVAAKVEVEDNQGTVTAGVSGETGLCLLATNALSTNKNYRIKITTKDGNVYQTNFLESKLTPEIDSISRKIENDGFRIYISTHDDSNKARYYSWDFQETWEIVSPVLASEDYKNGQFVDRDTSINISRCWQSNTSSEIMIESTERLSDDKIVQAPIAFVKGNSIKLSQLYSILIRQYAHTREGYEYLQNLKKNTEKIGTIFDAQPSELKGNLTCVTDPQKQVIGWIDAGTIIEERIFIGRRERLPGWNYQLRDCSTKSVVIDSVLAYIALGYLVDQRSYVRPPKVDMAKAHCIDCRLMGTNVKPSYWPN